MITRETQPFNPGSVAALVLPRRSFSYRLVTVFANVSTVVAVANRSMQLAVSDGAGNQIGIWSSSTPLAASSGRLYTFAEGMTQVFNVVDLTETVAIPPDLWIQQNWTVTLSIQNFQAGDLMSIAVFQSEFYPTAHIR